MKCPKCGYLGFETTERCRHCGYDFSLSIQPSAPSELSLRPRSEVEAPMTDFDLSGLDTSSPDESAVGPDLDRIIGQTDSYVAPSHRAASWRERPVARVDPSPLRDRPDHETRAAVATPPTGQLQESYPAPASTDAGLPLFTPPRPDIDPPRLAGAPPPARPPLAVRRATPEVARRRTPRTIRRDDEALALQLDTDSDDTSLAAERETGAAPRLARAASAAVDLALLGGINGAVLYLTLAIAGLTFADLGKIPPVPMLAFLLILNSGYLIAFTAANGQTIGKMLGHIRVIGDDGGRVDTAGAVLRSIGILLTFVLLGLPYLPVLIASDGRALHDRLAGTRVIKSA